MPASTLIRFGGLSAILAGLLGVYGYQHEKAGYWGFADQTRIAIVDVIRAARGQ